jgi:hypothetical protein
MKRIKRAHQIAGAHWGILMLSFLAACDMGQDPLFQLLPPEKTGIHFSNRIMESDTLNILNEEYIYNGGGVGIGDFNNDGLPDVYFTGNMVDNKLYINKGDFQFEDITEAASVAASGIWCSGVTVVDINQDGWMDMYVGVTLNKDSTQRKNLLYLNQGLNDQKIPTFKEVAAEYGLDDTGNTTHAAFLDYDKDGDLDLYVLTNVINNKLPSVYRKKLTDGTAVNNDRLYRNNGDGPEGHPTFTNVTQEAGILFEGYGLGLAITDINLDGWPDIYITNDYLSNDLLYINNQDGTFTNQAGDYFRHTAFSAMGNDVADINNDGLVDIIALDMLPENNMRKKRMIQANNYMTYINNEQYGFDYQYVRNVLQLNNGPVPEGHPVFSEIGQLSGVHQTDWSWTPLVADFDHDGYRDIIITNGFPRDVTDHDFAVYNSGPAGAVTNIRDLLKLIPEVKIPNYAFKNNGAVPGRDLTFSDKTKEWGLHIPSFSNGAAYADLDNDGDLDFIVNNIDDSAFVYRNSLLDFQGENHYLRVKLEGASQNQAGLGAKINIHYGQNRQQYYEHTLYRGYLSTVENAAHFGIGGATGVDSVEIFWPDGHYQLLLDVPADQEITLKWTEASKAMPPAEVDQELLFTKGKTLFQKVSTARGIQYKHEEQDKVDFNLQRTLPHKYTQYGPGIAVGDVNGDDLDDFFIGGSADKSGIFFLQSEDGAFVMDTINTGNSTGKKEDMGVLLFDADGDGDLDLYTVSGSYEFESGSGIYQDQLYMNNGEGKYTLDVNALPEMYTSGSCVKAADFDQDGDLDLFVGGRVVPGSYPVAPQSYVLRNEGGKFVDVTAEVSPELASLGMVTDALWSDFDNDGQVDLIIAGEWLPITFFKNDKGNFENVTEKTGIAEHTGWWNSLVAGDFDHDGDIDYVAGNLGLNTSYIADKDHPVSVYAKDFDGNGSVDPILVCYMKDEQGELKPFPFHTRDDLISQMVRIKQQFPRYEQYGRATIHEVLSEEDIKEAEVYHASHFASSYLENLGNGKFQMSLLPTRAQFAPVFGMLSQDFDGDGNLDILLAGNDYGTEVFTGRYDALIGLYLKGDGKGGFEPVPVQHSGFYVGGNAKGMASLYDGEGQELILVSQNQDSLHVFANSNEASGADKIIALQPMDAWAEVQLENGQQQRVEFYYGSTYLSQSSRKFKIAPHVTSVMIYDFAGNSRKVDLRHRKMAAN